MSKKIIIILILLALVAGGYFFWKTQMRKSAAEQAVENIQEVTAGVAENVSEGVLPEVDTGAVNPLESAQGANPYEETNPFSDIKTNPFE